MSKEYKLLLVVLIIAAGLRVANLASLPPGLYPDEAMNGSNAQEALTTGDFKIFYPENNGREGLFMNIQAMFVATLGNKPWVLRLPSAIFGTFTVLGLYFLARELFRKKDTIIPIVASFLLATNFWHINFSRIGFRAIMAPFFLVWGLYFFIKLKESKRRFLYAVMGGALYGLGFYSYIAYRATPVIMLIAMIYLWFEARDKNELKDFYKATALFIITSILVVLPLALYFLDNPGSFLGRTTQVSVFSSDSPIKDLALNSLKTLGMFNFAGDYNWRHNISGQPELFWPVGLLFILGTVLTIKSAFKKDISKKDVRWPALITLGWFGVAASPVVVSNEGLPHALRAILMIPPVVIMAAWGGDFVYQNLKGRFSMETTKKIVAIMAILMVIEAWHSYFVVWGKNPNTADAFSANYVKLAEEVNQMPVSTPKVIVVNTSGIDVRGIPMPAQTVMFLTNSFTEGGRLNKNISYITPEKLKLISLPPESVIRFLNEE